MINPFNSDEQRLVNLSSGIVPTNAVTEDMKKMHSLRRGEDAVHSFINTMIPYKRVRHSFTHQEGFFEKIFVHEQQR